MAFKSDFIWHRLGDFWRRFAEHEVFRADWDGLIELVSNISLNAQQVDRGKGLLTIPVLHRSSPVLFIFDETTAAEIPSGYASAFSIDSEIVSIPELTENSDGSGIALFETAAYDIVSPGVVAFKTQPPREMFASDVYSNRDRIYRNFGYPIGFRQPNSQIYLERVQGLWYALWGGASIQNILLGFHILLGLPFARQGTVESVTPNPDGTTTVIIDGKEYVLPDYVNARVVPGQAITNFKRLSDGTDLWDFINNESMFELFDVPQPQKFFTFIPVVESETLIGIELETGELFDFGLIKSFLDKIRPAYTNYIIGVRLGLKDVFELCTQPTIVEFYLDLSKTVEINYMNYLILDGFASVNGIPGATLQDQVNAVKDLPEFALDEERIAFKETFTVYDSGLLAILTPTVENGPLIETSPAAGFNPVNHFSLGAAFETLNGVTLADYNDHLVDYPQFDLDLETIALKDTLTIKDFTTLLPLVTV